MTAMSELGSRNHVCTLRNWSTHITRCLFNQRILLFRLVPTWPSWQLQSCWPWWLYDRWPLDILVLERYRKFMLSFPRATAIPFSCCWRSKTWKRDEHKYVHAFVTMLYDSGVTRSEKIQCQSMPMNWNRSTKYNHWPQRYQKDNTELTT